MIYAQNYTKLGRTTKLINQNTKDPLTLEREKQQSQRVEKFQNKQLIKKRLNNLNSYIKKKNLQNNPEYSDLYVALNENQNNDSINQSQTSLMHQNHGSFEPSKFNREGSNFTGNIENYDQVKEETNIKNREKQEFETVKSVQMKQNKTFSNLKKFNSSDMQDFKILSDDKRNAQNIQDFDKIQEYRSAQVSPYPGNSPDQRQKQDNYFYNNYLVPTQQQQKQQQNQYKIHNRNNSDFQFQYKNPSQKRELSQPQQLNNVNTTTNNNINENPGESQGKINKKIIVNLSNLTTNKTFRLQQEEQKKLLWQNRKRNNVLQSYQKQFRQQQQQYIQQITKIVQNPLKKHFRSLETTPLHQNNKLIKNNFTQQLNSYRDQTQKQNMSQQLQQYKQREQPYNSNANQQQQQNQFKKSVQSNSLSQQYQVQSQQECYEEQQTNNIIKHSQSQMTNNFKYVPFGEIEKYKQFKNSSNGKIYDKSWNRLEKKLSNGGSIAPIKSAGILQQQQTGVGVGSGKQGDSNKLDYFRASDKSMDLYLK